jgi:hypothetical protein
MTDEENAEVKAEFKRLYDASNLETGVLLTEIDRLTATVDQLRADLGLVANQRQYALAEVDRLKAGRFTPEEFAALCHCLSEEDACRFKQGCEEYQRRLFGKGAVEEERQRCLLIVEAEPFRFPSQSQVTAYEYMTAQKRIMDEITRKIREGK